MANVCSVPLSYIILRGQGIKIQSLVSKECKNEDYILRELEKKNDDSSYEGAIVLPPIKGMYLEEPVSVLDYASLYPSSMIASNISHEGISSNYSSYWMSISHWLSKSYNIRNYTMFLKCPIIVTNSAKSSLNFINYT